MFKNNSLEWIEKSYLDTHRLVYTEKDINVVGFTAFGWNKSLKATEPLLCHYHKDTFEFVYVVSGNIKFKVDDNTFDLFGGDFFIVPPNVLHSSDTSSISTHQIFWFQINIADNEILNLSSAASQRLKNELLQLKTTKLSCTNKNIYNDCKQIMSLLPCSNGLQSDTVSSLMVKLLFSVINYSDFNKKDLSSEIEIAINFIEENIMNDITLNEIANSCNLSLSRFKQRFSSEIGQTPREYINSLKIEIAKDFLKYGMNVTDTAMSLGFSNPNYFSTVFKKFTKMTPTEFLNMKK